MICGHLGVAALVRATMRDPRGRMALVAMFAVAGLPDLLDVAYFVLGICSPYGLYSHTVPAIALETAVVGGAAVLITGSRPFAIAIAALVPLHLAADFLTMHKLLWPGGDFAGLNLYAVPVADFLLEAPIVVVGWLVLRRSGRGGSTLGGDAPGACRGSPGAGGVRPLRPVHVEAVQAHNLSRSCFQRGALAIGTQREHFRALQSDGKDAAGQSRSGGVCHERPRPQPDSSPMIPDHHDDPLAGFELPPDVMSSTFEHAISDAADKTHEQGHAVAAALQKALKGSIVEYAFPGFVTAHLASGAVARCGGPVFGWMIDVDRPGKKRAETIEVAVPDDSNEPKRVAEALAKALKPFA